MPLPLVSAVPFQVRIMAREVQSIKYIMSPKSHLCCKICRNSRTVEQLKKNRERNNFVNDSGNIATRVEARNEKARKKTAQKQSQHLKARNLGNTSSSKSPSHEY